ncbi:hypothetical protein Tco_0307073 [Tanacetum coccineum]
MNQAITQQIALDEALVSTDDRVKIVSCNMRIDPTKTQTETTYQVVQDILKLSLCYNAFLILADVPEIYMQQFWFTISKIKDSVPNEEFVAPPPHDSLVTFIKSLGYKGALEYVSNLYIDHMYQPWRTFASIINKCVSGKTACLDRRRLSRVQILCGLFYKKNVDYSECLWEDFQYQIDYRQKSVRRRESMPYPRFTKVIINHFLSKHKSISKRQGLFMNSIKDEAVLGRLKFVSKGEYSQVYRLSILNVMVNDDIKNSKKNVTEKATSDESVDEQEGRLNRRKQTGVVIKDNPNVSTNKTLDQSQKLKEVPNEPNGKTKGSSEGAGITLEVPDEPKGKSIAQADEWGSNEEEIIFSSDDERTETEK